MRLPSVLDLLDAVARVSRAHPTIRAWWLTPRARLPLRGEQSAASAGPRVIELGVEHAGEGPPDYARIERDLSELLPASAITVRDLRQEDRRAMLRLMSFASPPPEEDVAQGNLRRESP